jgi:hypothetical protein
LVARTRTPFFVTHALTPDDDCAAVAMPTLNVAVRPTATSAASQETVNLERMCDPPSAPAGEPYAETDAHGQWIRASN